MHVNKLFEIKELSQEFMQSPKVVQNINGTILMYDYETENGEYTWTGITFLKAIAFKHTNDEDINECMVEAYNAVAEVKDSNWVNELSLESKQMDGEKPFIHYLVYFDGYGAYEFLSTGVYQGIISEG